MDQSPELIPNPARPEEDTSSAPVKKYPIKRLIFDLLETLILSVLIFLVINTVSARIRVESVSMQPTLYEGDFVIVNRLAYRFGEPGRGDIIVFRPPTNPQAEPYIKRVIGLPGDRIHVENGVVAVNGVALREPYIKSPPNYTGTWVVPQDSLFVLGDNRNNSSDSHQWGMVPLSEVIGTAEVIYLPVSHWQVLNPSTAAAAQP